MHILQVPSDPPVGIPANPAATPATTPAGASAKLPRHRPAASTGLSGPAGPGANPANPSNTLNATKASNAAVAANAANSAKPAKAAISLNEAKPSKAANAAATPPGGSPTIGLHDPTPVHKSAINLSPMEQMLWNARLEKAKAAVASQMKVKVTGGKLVRRYTAIDHDDGLFEIATDHGFYAAVLSKTGEYSIYWRHDRKAY